MLNLKYAFRPTLRLVDGLCFTSLKSVEENEFAELFENLEFTTWSPDYFFNKPSVPSDILTFGKKEFRIYHASTKEQLDYLLENNSRNDFKICGFRVREENEFKLPGISFCEDIAADALGISFSDFQLAYHALNDLCDLINQASNHWSMLESTVHFQETFEMISCNLPRAVLALTDELDLEQVEDFKHEIYAVHGYRNRKIFFGRFFDTFLSEKSKGTRELFVALMDQRSKSVELFSPNEFELEILNLPIGTLKPFISSIDIILYDNFIGPFHNQDS